MSMMQLMDARGMQRNGSGGAHGPDNVGAHGVGMGGMGGMGVGFAGGVVGGGRGAVAGSDHECTRGAIMHTLLTEVTAHMHLRSMKALSARTVRIWTITPRMSN